MTRRKALATSPGFSMLLDVRRPGDGPRSRSCTLGFVWHTVDLAQPDHAASRGQPSTEPARASFGSAPGVPRGSPREVDGMPHPARPTQPQPFLRLASRRSARPARARSFRLTSSSGRPSKAEVQATAATLTSDNTGRWSASSYPVIAHRFVCIGACRSVVMGTQPGSGVCA